jgi:glycosyltransferase involved in cell wall biosynthesis
MALEGDSGISVIIPAREEEQTIGLVVRDCLAVLGGMDLEYEVIVVDDGSTDGTAKTVEGLDCTLLRNDGPGHGKGIALRKGFAAARYQTFLMLDADYSHRAEDIPLLWEEFSKGYGLVVADRLIGGSDEYTFSRCYGNLFLTTVFSTLFGVQLNDSLNGFKIFDRRVYDSFTFTAEDFSIEIELLANTKRLGLSIGQIRSHERARQGGTAKSFAIRHGFSFLFRILHERWRNPERQDK